MFADDDTSQGHQSFIVRSSTGALLEEVERKNMGKKKEA
jgi:hypothetical protein